MHRLKVLLPHSHISSDIILSGIEGVSPTLARRQSDHHETSLLHTDDRDSDDNEDNDNQTLIPFTSSSSSWAVNKVTLPAMLASHASSSGGVIAAPPPIPQSGDGCSDSVGSLEQTPLDLSLDASPQSSGDTPPPPAATICTAGGAVRGVASSSQSPSPGGQPKSKAEVFAREHKLEREQEGDLRRKDGCVRDTRKAIPPQPPPSKRTKVATSSGEGIVPRQLFQKPLEEYIDLTLHQKPLDYIDLTLHDSPDTCDHNTTAHETSDTSNTNHLFPQNDHPIPNNDHQCTLNNDHHPPNHSKCPSPLVIVDSSSSDSSQRDSPSCSKLQDSSLSPDILPPTPGREAVDSILERKKLTVL